MPEILTQSQIDALLKGIDSGEVETLTAAESKTRRIKDYDFRSPKRFTKEQLKTLESLHENLARVLSSFFSGFFRTYCEFSILQIEEQRFYEYNNALQDISLISLIDLKPVNENFEEIPLMIDTATDIGFYMIDRLLGGSGVGYNLNRDYTDIEIAVLEKVYKKITYLIKDVWRNYFEVTATFNGIETNSRMLQTHSPDEVVVIILYQVKIKDITGSMSICISASSIEKLVGNFYSKYSRTNKRLDVDRVNLRKQIILNSLTNSDLEMKAVLQELPLDLNDILRLQVNDVIPLNKKIDSNICIKVEDVPWFECELGETNLKKAVKIDQLIKGDSL
jgi:flagellar motor switch protein FliM